MGGGRSDRGWDGDLHEFFFNFMDGTDGMAGGVVVLAAAGLAGLAWQTDAPGTAQLALVVVAAAGGFLVYNYPPASIFMGDAGSQFLGYTLGLLAVLLMRAGVSPMLPVMVLAPVIFDAALTLLRRALAGEVVWRAHRSHLYQRLVRHGYSHGSIAWIYYGWTILATGLAWTTSIAPARLDPLLAAAAFAPGIWVMALTRAVERRVVHRTMQS